MSIEKSDAKDESEYPSLKPFWQSKYRKTSAKSWNDFYKRNTTNFFKDRHWLNIEFPSLLSGHVTGLEIGCGVGNLVYPVLEENPDLKLYACDFSEKAVELVKSNDAYHKRHTEERRLEAFVADITKNDALVQVTEPLDFITCIFVLSAIAPEHHKISLENLLARLKPGGCILFRDYAAGDLAQQRFRRATEVPKLQDFLYVRCDGTMSYFFSEGYFRDLVDGTTVNAATPASATGSESSDGAMRGGLIVETLEIMEKRTVNKKQGLDEARFFLQAVLRRPA